MDPTLSNLPKYLLPDISTEERIDLFNKRQHPAHMTPRERAAELQALGSAELDIGASLLRHTELLGTQFLKIDPSDYFSNYTDLVLDAYELPGIDESVRLIHYKKHQELE